ncbi:N-acetyl-gamma-glutamyl-phosphate reductase [Angulomicrobium tetraedrale]|uniref:N-acetyl-gamma-glutamyl-phosphate reductase n=1 Tax=Ancylobacter tetraedralis TaxID=217068 RepID=A0A839Z8I4_9HYPH|nr:N-acetyl-gamma-glutamyl-phosphate reductase [Ancylobacter tetraedralis]MBB3771220.1 N-acetyl-gamma-glutamyl-phosphate reductase [Ancylobacter tetraedralis]
MTDSKARIAILGASGYTGAELVRLLVRHPRVEIVALTADRKAGQTMAEVFPQFAPLSLPTLITIDEVDWSGVDLAFCALPHGTTQQVIKRVFETAPHIKIVDLSADFRLTDAGAYEQWYGHPHQALELQQEAVYGLAELYRDDIRKARLVANPGCYTTTAILPVVPLIEAGAIEPDHIVIDAKSGVTGAGRSAKESLLFTEVADGMNAYGVGGHRHMAELDQEFSKAAGRTIVPSFTPHLIPMSRGIYNTIYLKTGAGVGAEGVHRVLADFYRGETFVHVLPLGQVPHSRFVKGSNMAFIGVIKDRAPDRVIVIATTDNLVKGASGQAVQNMNLVLGFPEATGLEQIALFP